MLKTKTIVVNIRKTPADIYIGRPSRMGNPFKIGKDGDREVVIKKFREYFCNRLRTDPKYVKDVLNLEGHSLGCYCYPEPCHGNVYVEFLRSVANAGNHGCPTCHAEMNLAGIDIYKCSWCGREIDICEDEEL